MLTRVLDNVYLHFRSANNAIRMTSFVGSRQTVDFQTAEVMLHDAEDTLNKAEDCSRLPPALDILASLSKQHPVAWEARFGVKSIDV
jgi:hypothetical protein